MKKICLSDCQNLGQTPGLIDVAFRHIPASAVLKLREFRSPFRPPTAILLVGVQALLTTQYHCQENFTKNNPRIPQHPNQRIVEPFDESFVVPRTLTINQAVPVENKLCHIKTD